MQSKETLKIITKTKNERLFIEKWIQHHLKIIGDGKLIIFDHMSDDKHVLNIYEKYKKNILLIPLDPISHHDDIHYYQKFTYFYDAIAESSDFFTVIDSDEYLYLYDSESNTAIHDTTILTHLKENKDCDFFAPCWLENIEGEEDVLTVKTKIRASTIVAEFAELFHWGKPIINSNVLKNLVSEKFKNINNGHTIFLPTLNYSKTKTNFFIAHLKNLSAEQRIAANMNKLVSNKILSRNDDFEKLVELKPQKISSTLIRSHVEQTQRLLKKIKNPPSTPSQISHDKTIKINEDDKLYFANTFTKHAFSTFLNRDYLEIINYDHIKAEKKGCRQLYDLIYR